MSKAVQCYVLVLTEKFLFVHREWLCIKKQQKIDWLVQAQDSPSWLDKGKPRAQGDLTLVMSSQQQQGREALPLERKLPCDPGHFCCKWQHSRKINQHPFSFSLVATIILQFRKGVYYGFSLFCNALCLYFLDSVSLSLSTFFECAKVLKTSRGVLYNSLTCMKPGLLWKASYGLCNNVNFLSQLIHLCL